MAEIKRIWLCENCDHWSRFSKPNEEQEWEPRDGRCHRYPPTVMFNRYGAPSDYSRQPVTSEDDWCAEHSKNNDGLVLI